MSAKLNRRQLAGAGLGLAAAGALAAPAQAAAGRRRVSLEDRAEIADLFARYVWAYDCTDEDEFLALFTPDAVVVGKGTAYRDRAAILGWFRHLVEMREHEGDETWMHEAGQFHFVQAGRGWVVHAYATHFNGNAAKGMRGVRSLGYFTCECVRTGGEWRFRRFSISAWDRTRVPWKKPLPWDNLPAA